MDKKTDAYEKKDMLTIEETAEILGISYATVKNWIKLNKLPSVKKGKTYLFDKKSIYNLKESLADSDLLKRRRNKSTANGYFFPKSYISKTSPNYSIISSLISEINENKHLTEKDALAVLSYYGESFLNAISLDKDGKKRLLAPLYAEPSRSASKLYSVLEKYPLSYIEGEDTLGMLYISLRSLRSKKAAGAYYTPFFVVDKCMETIKVTKNSAICDPSCGTGNFLLRLPKSVPLENVYGYDIDNIAAAVTRINLAVRYNIKKASELDILFENIKADDFLLPSDNKDAGDQYDTIIGNPPWGYAYTLKEVGKLAKYYDCACVSGTPESFSLFTERALCLLKKGGSLSFVLPETILGAGTHEKIRSIIADKAHINSLFYLGEIFDKVQCPCILLTLSTPASTSFKVSVSFYKKCLTPKEGLPERLILSKNFDIMCNGLDTSSFHMLSNDKEKELIHKIESCDHFTLKGNADFALGIVTGANKALLSPVKKRGFEEIIKGTDIDRYTLKKVTDYIKYEPSKFQQIAPERMYRAKEKLIYKFISTVPIFAYDNKMRLSLNSANILIPKVTGYSVLYILAVLNSPVISFYYSHTCKNMKVLRSKIERLPIVKCDPKTEKEIAALAKKAINSKVSNKYILEINKKIASLYGLNSEELSLIAQ